MARAHQILIALAVLAMPAVAWAEPGAPTGHRPFLWLLVLAGAALVGSVPFWVERKKKKKSPAWRTWLTAGLLVLAFLIFVAPLIMILGSILITGRTM